MAETDSRYRFEGFTLDPSRRELLDAEGRPVSLTAKAFDVLCLLVRHRDRVVSRDELFAQVWEGRVVEDNTLTRAISALRHALGPGSRFVATVPGRGYQFVAVADQSESAAVSSTAEAGGSDLMEHRSTPADLRSERRVTPLHNWLVVGTCLVLLVLATLWYRDGAGLAPVGNPATEVPMVAVLPFRAINMADDGGTLGLGLADTLVTRLARVEGLGVYPLQSSRSALQRGPDALAAGRVLNATWLVDGSAQLSEQHVRVNVRLIDALSGALVWSNSYQSSEREVFTLQDQVADDLARAMSLPTALLATDGSPCSGSDPAAYRAFLRAHYELNRRSGTTLSAYRHAIELDPTCARAYAGMAAAHMSLAHNDRDPAEIFPLAKVAVERAMALDAESDEVWAAYGRYQQLVEWNWPEADRALRRAIAINPSSADAYFGLAHLLVSTGRYEEGLAAVHEARKLDPLSPLYAAIEAGFLTAAQQPEAARASLRQALELQPGFWIAELVQGGMQLDGGDARTAIQSLELAAAHSKQNSQVLAVLALALAADGQADAVERLRESLELRSRHAYVPAINQAAVLLAAGDTAEALDALEQAERQHDIRVGFIGVDARWNPLRGEPRFQALCHRMKLPCSKAYGRY